MWAWFDQVTALNKCLSWQRHFGCEDANSPAVNVRQLLVAKGLSSTTSRKWILPSTWMRMEEGWELQIRTQLDHSTVGPWEPGHQTRWRSMYVIWSHSTGSDLLQQPSWLLILYGKLSLMFMGASVKSGFLHPVSLQLALPWPCC